MKKLIINIKKIINKEAKPIDIFYYLQGNYRYRLFYTKLSWLIRKHIREQIEYRIEVMNPQCYKNGECIKCGCQTTQLQMCAKYCKGMCYPMLLDKKKWKDKVIINDGDYVWIYNGLRKKYFLFKETPTHYEHVKQF